MSNKNYFKDFKNITTERLKIRKLTTEDAKDIYEFTSLEETASVLSWFPHKNLSVTEELIKSVISKYEKNAPSQWGIEIIAEKKVIGISGFINYYKEHFKGEIAYVLSPKYQNQGYMTEALKGIIEYGFRFMELNRIEAKCEIDNNASERTMQKIGMKYEGCSTDYLLRKGSFRSYKFYSILKKDYTLE